ncbi:MAG TPA: hypothetical protein VK852_13635 [Desulfobacterales bacterium]|nr:hypothetical protein [Desulfobacterales bacterium]
MNVFNMGDLKRLMETEEALCLSMYMPAEPETPIGDAPRIRFKNLLQRAEKEIAAAGVKNHKAWQETLEKGHGLLQNDHFWWYPSPGLAAFGAPGVFDCYRLPLSFPEQFTPAGRFHIKPLLPLFMIDGRFYVLALSQNEVRLFDCTRHEVMPVALGEVSRGMAEWLQYDTKHYQLQFHTGAAPDGGRHRPAMYHGHGVGTDDNKDEIRRYFREVDRALKEIVGADQAPPLVVAGVDYLMPLFQESSGYSRLMPQAVSGNPESMTAEALHRAAWEIVRPEMERSEQQDRRRYRELAGKGYTAAGVRAVLPAAAHGKIDTLFVALRQRAPGAFDRKRNAVTLFGPEAAQGEDLLDLAAVEVLRHGGRVHAVPRERMPEAEAAVAAILRY